MDFIRIILSRCEALFRSEKLDADLDDELQTHIELAIHENLRAGAAALLLALLGVYGVLAYSVTLRRREFGIRIALGSGKSALTGLVLRQAALPVLLGTGVGLAMAIIALRWVLSLLYNQPVMDPMAVGGSVVLLLVAATVAAIVPARRAASTDPMRALRME